MGADHLDHTCATEDYALCGSLLFVASKWFPTYCCNVVSLAGSPGFDFLPLEA